MISDNYSRVTGSGVTAHAFNDAVTVSVSKSLTDRITLAPVSFGLSSAIRPHFKRSEQLLHAGQKSVRPISGKIRV